MARSYAYVLTIHSVLFVHRFKIVRVRLSEHAVGQCEIVRLIETPITEQSSRPVL